MWLCGTFLRVFLFREATTWILAPDERRRRRSPAWPKLTDRFDRFPIFQDCDSIESILYHMHALPGQEPKKKPQDPWLDRQAGLRDSMFQNVMQLFRPHPTVSRFLTCGLCLRGHQSVLTTTGSSQRPLESSFRKFRNYANFLFFDSLCPQKTLNPGRKKRR